MNLHEASCRSESNPGEKDKRKAMSDITKLMNLHEASKSNPGEKNKRKAMSDITRLSNTETIKCFPLSSFEHEHRTKTTVGLDRCGTTRIWRSMKARQPVRNE